MGTLNDITAKANNTKRRSTASSMAYQSLHSPEKENLGITGSPHFMTPTFASKQLITPATNQRNRSTTPVSLKSGRHETGHTFLKTAAKRVGLRRAGGEATLHSKKAAIPTHNKSISFPDKVLYLRMFVDMTHS